MNKFILPLLLAALAFPFAAAAEREPPPGTERSAAVQTLDVEGPLLIKGRGRLHGELKTADPAATRPVVFGGRLGAVRFVDLAGDLRVRCQGRGAMAVREDDAGHKVVVCKGRAGRIHARGSHFELQLVARQYAGLIPAGVTGSLKGTFRTCVPGATCVTRDGSDRRSGKVKPPKGQAPTDAEIEQALKDALGGQG